MGTGRLYFPSVITRLLRAHHVEEELYYDRTIQVMRHIRPFDIIAVKDPLATVVNVDQRFICVEDTRATICRYAPTRN